VARQKRRDSGRCRLELFHHADDLDGRLRAETLKSVADVGKDVEGNMKKWHDRQTDLEATLCEPQLLKGSSTSIPVCASPSPLHDSQRLFEINLNLGRLAVHRLKISQDLTLHVAGGLDVDVEHCRAGEAGRAGHEQRQLRTET